MYIYIHLFVNLSIYLSYLSLYLTIYLVYRLPIKLSDLSIYRSIYLCMVLCIYVPVYMYHMLWILHFTTSPAVHGGLVQACFLGCVVTDPLSLGQTNECIQWNGVKITIHDFSLQHFPWNPAMELGLFWMFVSIQHSYGKLTVYMGLSGNEVYPKWRL